MRCRSLMLVAAVIAAGAAPAAAGTSFDVEEIRALLARGRFSSQQAQAALVLLDRAERGGLPVVVLTNRIREGIARRAEPKAILGVVEDRLAQFQRADDVVRRCRQQGVAVRDLERSLVRLADSFGLGVRPADVLDLVPGAAKGKGDLEGLARAAEVMARLERKGFPSEETREVVGAALVAAWSAERMEELVGLFLEADVLHLSPDEARQVLVDGIREKKAGPRLVDGMRQAAEEARAARGESRGFDRGPGAAAEKRGGTRANRDRGQRPD